MFCVKEASSRAGSGGLLLSKVHLWPNGELNQKSESNTDEVGEDTNEGNSCLSPGHEIDPSFKSPLCLKALQDLTSSHFLCRRADMF